MATTPRILSIGLLTIAIQASSFSLAATCPGATASGAESCLYHAGFSTVAGDLAAGAYRLQTTNMDPWQRGPLDAELEYRYQQATAGLQNGQNFYNGLLLIGAQPGDGSPRGRMLQDPSLNYETAGLLDGFLVIEEQLLMARNTLAYLLYLNWGDPDTLRTQLLNTVKTLANLYLMIGDEYLVDALEWRFPAGTVGADPMLDVQIDLLSDAVVWYEKAIASFVYGFSPAVGTNLYISDSFDDAVYGLFSLSVERTSLALRERSSRQLARLMAPDPRQNPVARATALGTLKSASIDAYLNLAAIADRQGTRFDAAGAGSGLVDALAMLRKQGSIYNQGLNPLGYDDRYVPLIDYGALYDLANSGLAAAEQAWADKEAEKRYFDTNLEQLRAEIDRLTNTHVSGLSAMTGCTTPTDLTNPDQVQAFVTCTGEAGGDLFACSLDMSAADFDACVNAAATGGALEEKYRAIAIAQTRLNAARLSRDNILTRIALENEKTNRIIALRRRGLSQQVALDQQYLPLLQKARTIRDTRTETTRRIWQNGRWEIESRTRDHVTDTSFAVKNQTLQIETKKAIELLQLTTELEIENVNLATQYVVKDLLLTAAEAENEIELAVQQKNSAIADFDHTFQQKENQWFAFQLARDQLRYITERTAIYRILRAQAAITLAERMNYVAHYAYLAAKAAEYQYVIPLDNVSVPGAILRMTDLFKAQTPSDLRGFLLALNAYMTTECGWGTFQPDYPVISLAVHLLGLTDRYLDPDGDGFTDQGKTIVQARKEAVQTFIRQHVSDQDRHLRFSFTIPDNFSLFAGSRKFNVKLWSGPVPSPCDPLVSAVIGSAVNVLNTQSVSVRPRVLLRQSGHSSLRDAFGDLMEYIPIGNRYFMIGGTGDYFPVKQAEFSAFVNSPDPRGGGNGVWTSAFKGRSLLSSNWDVEFYDWNPLYAETDWSKVTDIQFHFDSIGQDPME